MTLANHTIDEIVALQNKSFNAAKVSGGAFVVNVGIRGKFIQ